MNRFLVGFAALLAATALALPAAARSRHPHGAAPARAAALPGQLQYVVIQNHDPGEFERAARTGRDLLRGGQVKAFRIILSGRAVLLAIPGSNSVQSEVGGIMRSDRRLDLVVCREVVAALARAAHRQPPLMPGTKILSCNGLGHQMDLAGWETVPGL